MAKNSTVFKNSLFKEKCRVLEEALNVLAKEHHELEQTISTHMSQNGSMPRNLSHKSPRIYDTDDDEFYDAFEQGKFSI